MEKKKIIIGTAGLLGAAAAGGVVWMKTRPTIPEGVEALEPFDKDSYLGQWYEVARMPMIFEKNLTRVTAFYAQNDDGSIQVINRGFDPKKMKWQESRGRAVFVDSPKIGMLKVSFFGPFYSGYNVIEVDRDYNYALVFGRNLDYMWLMSREKDMPKRIEESYLKKARQAGYDLSKLIWTEQ